MDYSALDQSNTVSHQPMSEQDKRKSLEKLEAATIKLEKYQPRGNGEFDFVHHFYTDDYSVWFYSETFFGDDGDLCKLEVQNFGMIESWGGGRMRFDEYEADVIRQKLRAYLADPEMIRQLYGSGRSPIEVTFPDDWIWLKS